MDAGCQDGQGIWAWFGQGRPPYCRHQSCRQLGFRLAKNALNPSVCLCLDAQSRQPRRRFKGCGCTIARRRMGHIAYERLGFCESLRRAPQQRLGDARAAGIEQIGRHYFMRQPNSLRFAAVRVSAVKK